MEQKPEETVKQKKETTDTDKKESEGSVQPTQSKDEAAAASSRKGKKDRVTSRCFLCQSRIQFQNESVSSCQVCGLKEGSKLIGGAEVPSINLRTVTFCKECLSKESCGNAVRSGLKTAKNSSGVENPQFHGCALEFVENNYLNNLKLFVCVRINGCWNKLRREEELTNGPAVKTVPRVRQKKVDKKKGKKGGVSSDDDEKPYKGDAQQGRAMTALDMRKPFESDYGGQMYSTAQANNFNLFANRARSFDINMLQQAGQGMPQFDQAAALPPPARFYSHQRAQAAYRDGNSPFEQGQSGSLMLGQVNDMSHYSQYSGYTMPATGPSTMYSGNGVDLYGPNTGGFAGTVAAPAAPAQMFAMQHNAAVAGQGDMPVQFGDYGNMVNFNNAAMMSQMQQQNHMGMNQPGAAPYKQGFPNPNGNTWPMTSK